MSTENEALSSSDSVRSHIQKYFDEKIDLSIASHRTAMIKKFKEENPNINSKSADTIFSREIPKIGKAYNFQKEDLKKKPAVKYDKSKLGGSITKQPSDIKTVSIKNPALDPTQTQSMSPNGIVQAPKYEIKQTQVKAMCESFYGLLQLSSQDLEDLTESEAEDLGDLNQPWIQAKLGNSDRGQYVIAAGGDLGILAKKIKKARKNKKERLAKESKENNHEKTPEQIATDKLNSEEK